MRRRLVLLLLLGTFAGIHLPAQAPAQQRPVYRIVVNPENPVRVLPADEVSRLFLKKTTRWPGGMVVMPVDLAEGSRVRDQLSLDVHRRSTRAIKAYWQQMVFSGRAAPPPEVEGDDQVLSYVREHPGAIGYVAAETRLEGVEQLALAAEERGDRQRPTTTPPRGGGPGPAR